MDSLRFATHSRRRDKKCSVSSPIAARVRTWGTGLLVALLLGGAAISAGPAAAATPSRPSCSSTGPSPTRRAGRASSRGLQKRGYPVIAAANPLRGLTIDSAYLKNLLAQIKGPIVLVGHSYGGFVMTNAATGNPNVQGARLHRRVRAGRRVRRSSSSSRTRRAASLHRARSTCALPDARRPAAPEGTVKPSAFRRIFAADLPASLTKSRQRPSARPRSPL